MTTAEIVPAGGLVAAIGVLLVLVAEVGVLRLLGLALLTVGALPLIDYLVPTLQHAVEDRPVLAGAGALAVGTTMLLLAVLAVARPWLVPVAAVAVGWLRVPIGSGAGELNLLVPLYAVIAAGTLAEVWRILRRRGRPARLGVVGWALGAYVVVAAASLFWTEDLEQGAVDLLAFYLPFALLAALLGGIPLAGRVPAVLAGLVVGLGVAFAGVAVYQWETRELFSNPKVIYVNAFTDFFRVNSVFFDPSIFGRFCVVALLVAVGVLALAAPARRNLLCAVAAPPIAVGLWLSYSQTSFAALAAGLVLLAFFAWKRRTAIVLALALVVLLAGALALPATRNALSENVDTVTSDRSFLAERGLDVFRDRPAFGAGLGSFGTAAGRTKGEQRRLRSHTAPIAVASELGAIGLAILVALALAVIRATRRAMRRPGQRAIAAIMATCLFAIGVHSLAYNALFEDPASWALAAWLALLAGSVAAQPAVAEAEAPEPVAVAG